MSKAYRYEIILRVRWKSAYYDGDFPVGCRAESRERFKLEILFFIFYNGLICIFKGSGGFTVLRAPSYLITGDHSKH